MENKFEDKMIKCSDCNEEFAFTIGEQEFFAEKGFTNEPKRCIECRKARKAKKDTDRNQNWNRTEEETEE